MKVLCLAIVALFGLTGCSWMQEQFPGVSVGMGTIGYENTKFKTVFAKVNDLPEGQHFRANAVAKQGQAIPQVTGTLTDIENGKQLDIFIK